MRTKKAVRNIMIFVAAVLTLACASSTPVQANQTDQSCPTGMTTYDVGLDDSSFDDGSMIIQVVRPNPGCNIPAMVCYLSDISYGGGISCHPLEDNN